MISILLDLIIGAIAGYIVTTFMKMDNSNMLFNCCLGIAGGIVGGMIGGILHIGPRGLIGHLVFAIAGAGLLIWLYRKFVK